MGQRLVITLRKDNREIAKIYYHWSGYTISAYQEARDLLRHIDPNGDVEDILFGAIKALTHNHVAPLKKFGGIQAETNFGGIDPEDGELELIEHVGRDCRLERQGNGGKGRNGDDYSQGRR